MNPDLSLCGHQSNPELVHGVRKQPGAGPFEPQGGWEWNQNRESGTCYAITDSTQANNNKLPTATAIVAVAKAFTYVTVIGIKDCTVEVRRPVHSLSGLAGVRSSLA